MNTNPRTLIARLGAVALGLVAPAVAGAQTLPAGAPQTQRIEVLAPSTLNPAVRRALGDLGREVSERTQGAVQISLRAYPLTERELLQRVGERQGEGVVLSQDGVVEACPGALALRTPRALPAEAFDRGLAAVRGEVARTCASHLAPMAWFSSGQRLLFARIAARPDGAVGAGLRAPRDLSAYAAGRFAAAEREAFGLSTGEGLSPLSFQSANDVALVEADMPGDPSTRSVLSAPLGHSLGFVALSREALDRLSPQQRAVVDEAFGEVDRRLTPALRQDEERAARGLPSIATRTELTDAEQVTWRQWASAVEARIARRDDGAGSILLRFLDAAGVAVAPTRQPAVTLTFEGVPASLRQGDYEAVMQREVPPRALTCYERILRIRPDAQARVTLQLSVRADGSVALLGGTRVTTEAQVPQTAWSYCLRDAIRQLRVAPPPAPTEPFDQVVDYALR